MKPGVDMNGMHGRILQRLARDITPMKVMSILDDSERQLLKQSFAWTFGMRGTVYNHAIPYLHFLVNSSDEELESLRQIADWPSDLRDLLVSDPRHMVALSNIQRHVDDMNAFLESYLGMIGKAGSFDTFDAFSKGQITSKSWLVNTAVDLGLNLGKTWVLAGWVGLLPYLLFRKSIDLRINCIRSFDVDDRCAALAESLNHNELVDDWRFKASTLDVNDLRYRDFAYQTLSGDGQQTLLVESANTIINTSCDHMSDSRWFDSIPHGRLLILQNNDHHHDDHHCNIAASLSEFKSMYPMSEYLYEGSLDCNTYNRYMLIGNK